MAQPNFATIHQSLVGLTNEVALLPNLPAVNQPQLAQNVQQLLQQNVQIIQNLGQVNQTLIQINQRLQNMEDLLPIRLYNASISLDNPLRYPAAIAVVPPLPNTKAALRELTVVQCNAVAGALGLAQLGPGATVSERRKHISDYLGCAMKFE